MSAFALRRQLLSGTGSAVRSTQTSEGESTVPSPDTAPEPEPARRKSERTKGSSNPPGSKSSVSNGPETANSGEGADKPSPGPNLAVSQDPTASAAVVQRYEPVKPPVPKRLAHYYSISESSASSSQAVTPVVQAFSTFKLTKENSRKLPGGILRLHLAESEVASPLAFTSSFLSESNP